MVSSAGLTRKLDKSPDSREQFSADDLDDKERLARRLTAMLRRLLGLEARWRPSAITFEKKVVDATGTTKYRFTHNFGAIDVRYWAVGWNGSTAACLRPHADSDTNTLVLTSTVAGTVTLRVEEPG